MLFRATVAIAARAIFAFLLVWLCLKIPPLIAMPQIEGVWLGFGEIAMLLAGGWILFARLSALEKVGVFSHITGAKGLRIVLSGLAYLPLISRYGFAAWTVLFRSPFAFQQARIVLYALWFAAGVLIGVPGISAGLLSRNGSLAQQWKGWTVVCIAAYAALSVWPNVLAHSGMTFAGSKTVEVMLWVLSCVSSCFAFLAIFRGLEIKPSRVMTSLSRSAYVMYLVHYFFITWTQKTLMRLPVHAGIKTTLVFVSTVALSWLVARFLVHVPGVKTII